MPTSSAIWDVAKALGLDSAVQVSPFYLPLFLSFSFFSFALLSLLQYHSYPNNLSKLDGGEEDDLLLGELEEGLLHEPHQQKLPFRWLVCSSSDFVAFSK